MQKRASAGLPRVLSLVQSRPRDHRQGSSPAPQSCWLLNSSTDSRTRATEIEEPRRLPRRASLGPPLPRTARLRPRQEVTTFV